MIHLDKYKETFILLTLSVLGNKFRELYLTELTSNYTKSL